jgi:hypothetical protein
MLRMAAIALLSILAPAIARAQDAAEPPSPTPPPSEQDVVPEPPPPPPKVAIVVAGDPDEAMREAALRVESAIAGVLRAPIDPILRGALRGEAGEDDDGLDGVRRERQRLGLDEASDAPVLSSLGRRANASAVVVVRPAGDTPELVVFDVRNGAFFDGAIALDARAVESRIRAFVLRRANAAVRGAVPSPEVAARESPPEREPAPEPEQEDEPDFFEQFWPYMLAGVLLAGMIVAIAVTSSSDGPDQPVLHFEPGGR